MWPFYVTLFVLICAVFIFLAWRMDRKRKITVGDVDHGKQDQRLAETMFGDDRSDRDSRGNPRNLP